MSNSNKRKKLKIVKFQSPQQLQKDELVKVFTEEFDGMEEIVLLWNDKQDDLWYCCTKMPSTQLIGLLEMTKHYVIENCELDTED